ncbi:hypothetical protein PoB_004209400 [Plakobranchus ocellatus]|uniref:Uncharacterized protein n=1 Tax=Plakobranchus ocellatus TaxID=259542 RepID=A0AAV4B668_9GAST|nr:hypothetical protein PoB_004209400 [Plakobranchus ocellatus]
MEVPGEPILTAEASRGSGARSDPVPLLPRPLRFIETPLSMVSLPSSHTSNIPSIPSSTATYRRNLQQGTALGRASTNEIRVELTMILKDMEDDLNEVITDQETVVVLAATHGDRELGDNWQTHMKHKNWTILDRHTGSTRIGRYLALHT